MAVLLPSDSLAQQLFKRLLALSYHCDSRNLRPRLSIVAMASSSWACSKCTFLNPPSEKLRCTMCDSPSSLPQRSSSPSSSSSPSRWSCRACTYSNPAHISYCEICNTRVAPFSTIIDLDLEPDELSDPAIGSVFLPLQRCSSKRRPPPGDPEPDVSETDWRRPEKAPRKEGDVTVEISGNADTNLNHKELKVLTYNVWFREDLEVYSRMKALGDLIQKHSPDFICFQEVTPNIYEILQNLDWWKAYKCSVPAREANAKAYFCMQMSKLSVRAFSCKPFSNSIMGRELCVADVDTGTGKELVIATSHLESPCPAPPKWDQMFSAQRVMQAKQAVSLLKGSENTIFCGDMNWDDKLDGAFPLPDGWVDAWTELKPGEKGWTYDTKANQMLAGNRTLQKRLDRFICCLRDYKLESIEMIGMESIPGLSYSKEKKVKNEFKKLVLPILPSDHFGLLLTLSVL